MLILILLILVQAPLRFQTEELTGAIDGYYSVDTTTDTQFESFLNAKVPKRTISVASTAFVTIDSEIYINAENHKLNNSQKLLYGGAGLTEHYRNDILCYC